MSAIIDELKALITKFEDAIDPAVDAAVTDAEVIGKSALDFIKTNGLQDLYQIALTVVGAAATGAPWAGTLAAITAQAVADGKTIITGAEAVVAAQAQADLIAAGKLLAPVPAVP